MQIRTWLERGALIGAASCMMGIAAIAQSSSSSNSSAGEDWLAQCRDNNRHNDDRVTHCELRELTLAAPTSALTVDGRQNGGIRVSDVRGTMTLSTENGGIKLDGTGGDVGGETVNGGLDVKLDGDRWQGPGLDLTTRNGGVRMSLPPTYAARLETGTVNGHVSIDFPLTVQGQIGRRISSELNGGGSPVRVMTTNGGVRITRR